MILQAEEGASLSSGAIRLYALPYGCVDLYNYDPLNRRAAVGIMVATEYRRQGYALAMLRVLETQYYTALHCLYADIAVTNTASFSLFQKAGYTECGHFKDWLNVTKVESRASSHTLQRCSNVTEGNVNDKYIDTIRVQKIL